MENFKAQIAYSIFGVLLYIILALGAGVKFVITEALAARSLSHSYVKQYGTTFR